ncbi:hypothetical protein EXIGLDRAFT_235368 [Exidia glandulosa HHB12029]|uniref:Transmembrane protein n=1 Tax=Exidia glandulosa HHB12029 TaxID=1314781 RepID=A0A165E256_EXIGL|nr:hypothetical protein EXIGLDRAFT_235368 [Exidia glandulosa HHB12029]
MSTAQDASTTATTTMSVTRSTSSRSQRASEDSAIRPPSSSASISSTTVNADILADETATQMQEEQTITPTDTTTPNTSVTSSSISVLSLPTSNEPTPRAASGRNIAIYIAISLACVLVFCGCGIVACLHRHRRRRARVRAADTSIRPYAPEPTEEAQPERTQDDTGSNTTSKERPLQLEYPFDNPRKAHGLIHDVREPQSATSLRSLSELGTAVEQAGFSVEAVVASLRSVAQQSDAHHPPTYNAEGHAGVSTVVVQP